MQEAPEDAERAPEDAAERASLVMRALAAGPMDLSPIL